MEAEEESVKDQNWLPRSIPALSKGEEFYPEDTASPTVIKSPELRVSGIITYSQTSLFCSLSQSLRHLLEISVPSFLANTEQISYAADTSVHSVHHLFKEWNLVKQTEVYLLSSGTPEFLKSQV